MVPVPAVFPRVSRPVVWLVPMLVLDVTPLTLSPAATLRVPVTDSVWLIVVVLVPAVEPIVMAVVEPARPPVPRLIVLVLPEVVAPAWMSVVWETVDRPNVMLLVEEVPPIAIVPEEVRATVAELVVAKLLDEDIVPDAEIVAAVSVPVSVGLADSTTLPEPVAVAKSVKPKSQPAAVVTVVLIQTI